MSQLTDKYGSIHGIATNLGGTNLNAQEENGHLTFSGTLPTKYAVNQIWSEVKKIDPALNARDLTLNLTPARNDIYGEYEVQAGDTLSGIAKKVTNGALSYQQIFEANKSQLANPDQIKPGQKLVIPNF
ncbi:MAG: LysM peptidoglycan-binding domain-containing protein [Blastocatellia bacterium]